MYIYIYIYNHLHFFICTVLSCDLYAFSNRTYTSFGKGFFKLYKYHSQCKNIYSTLLYVFFSRKILWQFCWKMLESWNPYCSSRDKDMDDGNASSAPEQDHFRSLTWTQVVESDVESRQSQLNTPLVDAKKLTAKTPYVPKGWTLRQAQNHTHVIYVMHILSLDICGYHDTSTSAHIVLVTLSPEPLELRILSPGPAVQLETSCQSSYRSNVHT